MTRALPACMCAAALASVLFAGCEGGEKRRGSVSFHAKGVRRNIQRVRDQIPRTDNPYAMEAATDALYRALEGLPKRVVKNGGEGVEAREAKAEEALAFFQELRKMLEAPDYDPDQANAKLDELAEIIDQVEQ